MSKHNRDRRRRAAGKLPPANRVPQNLDQWQVQEVEEYGVGSWCPLPDGKGPATMVVLHMKMLGSEQRNFLRLKSARAVDELVAMLERHRNDVWPGAAEAIPE